MDYHADTSKGTFNLVKQAVTAVDMSKVAAAADSDLSGLPSSSFADATGRFFPVHSPEETILSAAYAAFHKDARALDTIKKFGALWGNADVVIKVAQEVQAFEQPMKFAMDLQVGPQHYTLFPYSGAHDIKEAATSFYENRHKLPWAAREKVATVLFEEIMGYGGNDETQCPREAFEYLTKAAGFGLPDAETADTMLCQRLNRVNAGNPAFAKVARILREIREDPQWDKIAMEAFDALDGEVGLRGAYGKTLRLPEEDLYVNSVLTAKTAAEQGIVTLMNGKAILLSDVDWAKVAEVDPVLYKEARGGEKAAEVLPTWPRPDADLLVEMLELPLVEV